MTVESEFALLCHFYCLQLVPAQMPAEWMQMDNSKWHWCNLQPIKYKKKIGALMWSLIFEVCLLLIIQSDDTLPWMIKANSVFFSKCICLSTGNNKETSLTKTGNELFLIRSKLSFMVTERYCCKKWIIRFSSLCCCFQSNGNTFLGRNHIMVFICCNS